MNQPAWDVTRSCVRRCCALSVAHWGVIICSSCPVQDIISASLPQVSHVPISLTVLIFFWHQCLPCQPVWDEEGRQAALALLPHFSGQLEALRGSCAQHSVVLPAVQPSIPEQWSPQASPCPDMGLQQDWDCSTGVQQPPAQAGPCRMCQPSALQPDRVCPLSSNNLCSLQVFTTPAQQPVATPLMTPSYSYTTPSQPITTPQYQLQANTTPQSSQSQPSSSSRQRQQPK